MRQLPCFLGKQWKHRSLGTGLQSLKLPTKKYFPHLILPARIKYTLSLLLLLFLITTAQAADQPVNKNWRSIAIKGYDPVAYFTMNKAVKGQSKYEFRWQNARWRFASEQHMKMFVDDPEKYAPRFGGYCAEGMAIGRKASINPQAWLIVEGELYLNYSVAVRDEMAQDPKDTIEKADRFWNKLGKVFLNR